jgi:hypothetical protein
VSRVTSTFTSTILATVAGRLPLFVDVEVHVTGMCQRL